MYGSASLNGPPCRTNATKHCSGESRSSAFKVWAKVANMYEAAGSHGMIEDLHVHQGASGGSPSQSPFLLVITILSAGSFLALA